MANIQPLINGVEQHYVQCTASAWGIEFQFTELNYKETQNKVNNKANAKYPVGRSYLGVEPTSASITLSGKTIDLLRSVSPSRRALHSLPLTDLIVTYGQDGQPTTTDVIKNFEFLDNGKEGSVEDDYFTTTLDCIFSHIE